MELVFLLKTHLSFRYFQSGRRFRDAFSLKMRAACPTAPSPYLYPFFALPASFAACCGNSFRNLFTQNLPVFGSEGRWFSERIKLRTGREPDRDVYHLINGSGYRNK